MRKTFTFLLAFLFVFSASSFSQNRALQFDGQNDYVSIPEKTGVLTGSTFSIEMWVKASVEPSTFLLVDKMNQTTATGFQLYFNNGILEADMNTDIEGYSVWYNYGAGWATAWHHIAVSYDGSLMELYVDGTLVSSVNVSGSVPLSGKAIQLGTYDNGTFYFNGMMDELRFWNTARTQAQIQANMNTEIPANTAGLVANYRMNQGTAGGNNTSITTLIDQVSTNYGTLMNFAKTGTNSNFVTGYATITVLAMKNASFTAVRKGSTVQLDWKSTASEGPSLFTVERSSNGIDFSPIGTVAAPASTAEAAHSFTDRTPLSILAHYRIRSTDADGRVTYSKTLAVAGGKAVAGLQAYPNPASSIIQLQVTAPKGAVLIEVKDLGGRTVQAMQMASQGNAVYTTMDISNLAKGMYTVTAGNESTLLIKQ
jgi:hypothetical protein